MDHQFIAKFEGADADGHSLPAYNAAQSIYGISRSQLIILNYLSERKVRRKGFDYRDYDIQLRAPRAGSVEFIFDIALSPTALAAYGALGLGVGGNLLTELLKGVYRKAIGKRDRSIWDVAIENGILPPGDVGALVDAVTPALKSAHQAVGGGANSISININGNNNVVTFDSSSKDFLTSYVIDNAIRVKEFSIGSFNANSGEGRAFDFDFGQLVSFDLDGSIDKVSVEIISDSIKKYALRKFQEDNSRIAARFTSINGLDGTVKKMRFSQVRNSIDELDASPFRRP